ncbi:MAG: DUF4352 domain-containing protein [Bacteroidetes bacterium]|nr:MAG: DUF4352 domain-containing protein [Bacteroidota bacterium]
MKTTFSLFVLASFLFFAYASSSGIPIKSKFKKKQATYISTDQKMETTYFDIQVNDVKLLDRVDTGKELTSLKAVEGHDFLIFNVTFKNTDTESRLFDEGDIIVEHDGKELKYEISETIFEEGWGSFFDQLNPLESKTTNLVYKIPSEIEGPIYWRPGRNTLNQQFKLGTAKELRALHSEEQQADL